MRTLSRGRNDINCEVMTMEETINAEKLIKEIESFKQCAYEACICNEENPSMYALVTSRLAGMQFAYDLIIRRIKGERGSDGYE